jgi:hypothetical protein
MSDCDAGDDCKKLDCPGECVAYWDHETGICHARCLEGAVPALPMSGGRFNIALGRVSGRNVLRLLPGRLPPELVEQLRKHRQPITLRLMNVRFEDLVVGLYESVGGMLAS